MGFLPGQLSPRASSVEAPSHTAETASEKNFIGDAHSTTAADSTKASDASSSSPLVKNPKPHTCTTCRRSFARSEHLSRHKLSHTKEKPFECTKCGRCFARRDLLLRHQRKLHPTSPSAKKDVSRKKPNGPSSARAPATLSQPPTRHKTEAILKPDDRAVLKANSLPSLGLGASLLDAVPASPALSASSYGSADTGVSHPPNAKREGKIMPMRYSNISNRSQTEPIGRASSTHIDSDGEFRVQSSPRRYSKGHEVECPRSDCTRSVKDLAAHLLTHENERPEKCFVPNCEYHIKGFGRKYDRDRHILTHFKGTMICDFCPDSAMSANNCFARVDLFKRHLSTVHGVEQMPPNKRKRPLAALTIDELTHHPSDTAGKCSVCCNIFPDAQLFYEHLDDCTTDAVQKSLQSNKLPLALPTKKAIVTSFTVVDNVSSFDDYTPPALSRM